MDTTSDKKKKCLVDLSGETYRDHDKTVNKNHVIFIRALLNSSVFTEKEKETIRNNYTAYKLKKMRAKL